MKKIPKIILEYAEKRGCNKVEYIGERKGKAAFVMGFIDEGGKPLPSGLPVVYLYDGASIEAIGGKEGLELL